MIELKNVKKSFGTQEVLQDISFKLENETLGLLGANGSGKTTLLKCMLGLLDYEGSIQVAGFDIKKEALQAKRRIGYIPQSFPLWTDLTASEAIRMLGRLRGAGPEKQKALLEEFDLAKHAYKPIAALSGGMRQKLSIAAALLADPDVLLLDEPTASLDAWATQEILRIFEGWKGKKTVILSSHRVEEVQMISHRLVQIQDGVLIEPSADLFLAGKRHL